MNQFSNKAICRYKEVICVALLTILALLVIAAGVGFYPFGTKSVLAWDLSSQYINYFYFLRRELPKGLSALFYTQSISFGAETYGLLSYYLSSPLNLIVFLFPIEKMLLAVEVLIAVKYVLASVFMCIYLKSTLKEMNSALLVMGALAYSFCGYMVAYQFNVMWLDGVVLLPLLTLGLDKLFRQGKKLLLFIALCLALLSNFYLGYMLWIYAFFYTLIFFLVDRKDGKKKVFINGCVTVLISVLVLLPYLWHVYGGIKASKMSEISSDSHGFIKTLMIIFAVIFFLWLIRIFRNHRIIRIILVVGGIILVATSRYADFWLLAIPTKLVLGAFNVYEIGNGMPNIFVPSIFVMGIIACSAQFTKNKHIDEAEEQLLMMLLVIWLSFAIGRFNIFWHGMNFPCGCNYRYSFMMSFILIVLSVRFIHEDLKTENTSSLKSIGICVGLFYLYLALSIYIYVENKNLFVQNRRLICTVSFEVISVLILVTLMRISGTDVHKKRALWAVMCTVTFIEICINAKWTLGELNYRDYREFDYEYKQESQIVKQISNPEDVFRIEFLDNGVNKGLRYGYDTISTYSSTLPLETYKYLSAFGMDTKDLGITCVAVNDKMTSEELGILNVKYIIMNEEHNIKGLKRKKQLGNYTVYENLDYEKRAFLVEESFTGKHLKDCIKQIVPGVTSVKLDSGNNGYIITYSTDKDATLVVSIMNDGKWKSQLDGIDVSNEQVLGGMIGIHVPQGSHQITLYR